MTPVPRSWLRACNWSGFSYQAPQSLPPVETERRMFRRDRDYRVSNVYFYYSNLGFLHLLTYTVTKMYLNLRHKLTITILALQVLLKNLLIVASLAFSGTSEKS